jgi:hypothetical protein
MVELTVSESPYIEADQTQRQAPSVDATGAGAPCDIDLSRTVARRPAWTHDRGPVARLRVAATVAVVGMVVAGCGGSSSPKRPFARTANAICANTYKSLAMVPAVGGTLTKLALDVADQLPIYEKQLKQLSALTPPASKRSAYATALSSARTDVTLLHRLYLASRAGDKKEVLEIAHEGSSAYSAAGTGMRRIGLTRCVTSL